MSHNVTLLEDDGHDLKDDIAPEYDLADMERAAEQERRLRSQATVTMDASLSRSLFDQADAVAREMNVSITDLFVLALEECVRRHQGRKLFDSYNQAYQDGLDEEEQELLRRMRPLQRQVVEGEW